MTGSRPVDAIRACPHSRTPHHILVPLQAALLAAAAILLLSSPLLQGCGAADAEKPRVVDKRDVSLTMTDLGGASLGGSDEGTNIGQPVGRGEGDASGAPVTRPGGDPVGRPDPIPACGSAPLASDCPCATDEQCESGFCVRAVNGKQCARTCLDSCPDGWTCREVGEGADPVLVCMPKHQRLCWACNSHDECEVPASLGKSYCVPFGDEGSFCGGACSVDGVDCPPGYMCDAVELRDLDMTVTQCVPAEGICECPDGEEADGRVTECLVQTRFGVCPGIRQCTASGLSPCTLDVPDKDYCDGMDGDCDGDVDEEGCIDDGLVCTIGECRGEEGCAILDGWCLIDNECYPDGRHNPDNQCQVCRSDQSVYTWAPDPKSFCDDGLGCTDDSCAADGRCLSQPKPGACFIDGKCYADGDISPENTCEMCVPSRSGTAFSPNEGAECADGDPCTVDETCHDGECVGDSQRDCDDDNACTHDSCDSERGCVYEVVDGPCDDHNPCTTGDACTLRGCLGTPVVCQDGEVCSDGQCVPAITSETPVASDLGFDATLPRVVTDLSGGYALFFHRKANPVPADAAGEGLWVVSYKPDGSVKHAPVQIANGGGGPVRWNRAAAGDLYGNFVVTWAEQAIQGDGGGYGVRQMQLDNGLGLGEAEHVPNGHDGKGDQLDAAVGVLQGGWFTAFASQEGMDQRNHHHGRCRDNAVRVLDQHQIYSRFFVPLGKGAVQLTGAGCPGSWVHHDQLFAASVHDSQALLATKVTQNDGKTQVRLDRWDALGNHKQAWGSGYTVGVSSDPVVVASPDGGYLLVWTEYHDDGSAEEIVAQPLSSSFSAAAPERFRVNSFQTGAQNHPVALSMGDGVVILWESWWQDGAQAGIYGQRLVLDEEGSWVKRDEEFPVNTTTAGSQSNPSLARLTSTHFVVAWQHKEGDAPWQIKTRVMGW